MDTIRQRRSNKVMAHPDQPFADQNLQKFFSEQKISLNVQSITSGDLQKYFVGYMVKKKLAPNTINGRVASCKSFFGFLLRNQFIKSNVAENLPFVKAPKDTIATFTNDELLRLLQKPIRRLLQGCETTR